MWTRRTSRKSHGVLWPYESASILLTLSLLLNKWNRNMKPMWSLESLQCEPHTVFSRCIRTCWQGITSHFVFDSYSRRKKLWSSVTHWKLPDPPSSWQFLRALSNYPQVCICFDLMYRSNSPKPPQHPRWKGFFGKRPSPSRDESRYVDVHELQAASSNMPQKSSQLDWFW